MPRTKTETDKVDIKIDRNEDLSVKNSEQYKTIVKTEQYRRREGNKTKIIQRDEYKNGVVKERVVGLLKSGTRGDIVLFDAGIKK